MSTGSNTSAYNDLSISEIGTTSAPLLIKTIFVLGAKIYEATKREKTNNVECFRLGERVMNFNNILKEYQFNQTCSETVEKILKDLTCFLEECLLFIYSFYSMRRIKRVFKSGDYLMRFNCFHNQLTQYAVDLNFALSLVGRNRNTTDKALSNEKSSDPPKDIVPYDKNKQEAVHTPTLPSSDIGLMMNKGNFDQSDYKVNILLYPSWNSQLSLSENQQDTQHFERNYGWGAHVTTGIGTDYLHELTSSGLAPFTEQVINDYKVFKEANEAKDILSSEHQPWVWHPSPDVTLSLSIPTSMNTNPMWSQSAPSLPDLSYHPIYPQIVFD